MAIKTDLKFHIRRDHGLSQTRESFKVTKTSSDKRFIHEINGKPAVQELLKLMSWPDTFINEKQLHSTTLYYPIGFKNDYETSINVVALISGNSLCMVHKLKSEMACFFSASGRELVEAVDKCLYPFKEHKPILGFIYSCSIRLDTLGSQIYVVREKLMDYFNETPFLLTYVTGEGIFKPNEKLRYGNDTFNLSVFWK